MTTAKTITLNLDKQLAEALAQRRIDTGTPVQEFIRRCVRTALYAECERPPKTCVGRPGPDAVDLFDGKPGLAALERLRLAAEAKNTQ